MFKPTIKAGAIPPAQDFMKSFKKFQQQKEGF